MNKKMTFEQAKIKLEKKHIHLKLLSFIDTNSVALFLDNKFGEFEDIFKSVYYFNKQNPKRSRYNRQLAALNPKRTEKRKKTCLQKYGVEHPTQLEEIKNKVKITFIKNYGVDNPSKCKKIRNKTEKTCLEKYNSKSPLQSENIKEKIKKTNLENLGVENPLQNKEIRNKVKQTMIIRHGVESPLQSENIKDKFKKTSLKNYGTENPNKCNEIKNKIIQTRINLGITKLINGKTIKEIAKDNNYNYNTIQQFFKNGGNIKDLEIKNEFNSLLESKFASIVDKLNINYKIGFNENFSLKINNKNYKPDFILKDQKLIIEVDGLIWHSDLYQKNNNYHKEKQIAYLNNGYRSLFLREDEINNKPEIVKSIISAKLNLILNKVFARKCIIKEIDTKEADQFFTDNHLMGKGSGKCYGLYYNNELISAIRIINKKDYIDISRFCNKLNTSVAGGLSKLMSHIIKTHKPQKIISFVDMRYGDGHSLEKIGFKEVSNHLSFRWTNFKNTFHRLLFKGNSGYEKGLFKIWDCGQKKFELIILINN